MLCLKMATCLHKAFFRPEVDMNMPQTGTRTMCGVISPGHFSPVVVNMPQVRTLCLEENSLHVLSDLSRLVDVEINK